MTKSDGQNQCSIVDNFYFPSKISQFHAVGGGPKLTGGTGQAAGAVTVVRVVRRHCVEFGNNRRKVSVLNVGFLGGVREGVVNR